MARGQQFQNVAACIVAVKTKPGSTHRIYRSETFKRRKYIVKKTVGSLALVAALLMCGQSVLAQNYKGTPKPTIQDYGPFANSKVRTPDTARWQTETCGN